MIKDRKTFDTPDSKKASGESQVNQCTMQLPVFEDGILFISPLLSFRGQGLRIEKVKKKGLDKINWIKELLINFKRMLGVMKELRLLGYRATGAAIAAIHERPVPIANYLLQIFIETNEQLTLKK